MTQSEEAAAALPADQLTLSLPVLPRERMTIFRLSIALATHDPQRALKTCSIR
jgi:hypothetical protein